MTIGKMTQRPNSRHRYLHYANADLSRMKKLGS